MYGTIVLCVCIVGVLWPHGWHSWMDQGATWYRGRTRPKRHCVRCGAGTLTERDTAAPPHFLDHVYCGQMVAHLSNCWALVHGWVTERTSSSSSCSCGCSCFILKLHICLAAWLQQICNAHFAVLYSVSHLFAIWCFVIMDKMMLKQQLFVSVGIIWATRYEGRRCVKGHQHLWTRHTRRVIVHLRVRRRTCRCYAELTEVLGTVWTRLWLLWSNCCWMTSFYWCWNLLFVNLC